MKASYNKFRRFCAILIGLTFVLSGTFKLMDPIGTALKVTEYWNFFHLGFMKWSSLPVGTALSLIETGVGVMLICGIWRKFTVSLCSLMLLFFTFVTALLAAFNPAMDCGCFGEVVHLTNLQTLLKNIVLVVLALVAFLPFRDFGQPKPRKYVSFAICMCSSFALLVFSQLHLPLKDYTDYSPGTQLQASRSEAESHALEASFIYEKDGVEKVFTLDQDLPDTSWHFVRTETSGVVEEGARLAIADWGSGECLDTLAASGNVLVVSYYRNGRDRSKAHDYLSQARELGFVPLCLSLDCDGLIDNDFCYSSDRRSLIGLNRSNGGLTLIQDGHIISKWSHRDYPSLDRLVEIVDGDPLETVSDFQTRSNIILQSYLLYFFTVLLLL